MQTLSVREGVANQQVIGSLLLPRLVKLSRTNLVLSVKLYMFCLAVLLPVSVARSMNRNTKIRGRANT